jgi:hypothetical protein
MQTSYLYQERTVHLVMITLRLSINIASGQHWPGTVFISLTSRFSRLVLAYNFDSSASIGTIGKKYPGTPSTGLALSIVEKQNQSYG